MEQKEDWQQFIKKKKKKKQISADLPFTTVSFTMKIYLPNLSVNMMQTSRKIYIEIINCKCDSDLKIRFDELSLTEFYQNCTEKEEFVSLRICMARIFFLLEPHTYMTRCFPEWSTVSQNWGKKITDCHLEHRLWLAITEIVPGGKLLVKKK